MTRRMRLPIKGRRRRWMSAMSKGLWPTSMVIMVTAAIVLVSQTCGATRHHHYNRGATESTAWPPPPPPPPKPPADSEMMRKQRCDIPGVLFNVAEATCFPFHYRCVKRDDGGANGAASHAMCLVKREIDPCLGDTDGDCDPMCRQLTAESGSCDHSMCTCFGNRRFIPLAEVQAVVHALNLCQFFKTDGSTLCKDACPLDVIGECNDGRCHCPIARKIEKSVTYARLDNANRYYPSTTDPCSLDNMEATRNEQCDRICRTAYSVGRCVSIVAAANQDDDILIVEYCFCEEIGANLLVDESPYFTPVIITTKGGVQMTDVVEGRPRRKRDPCHHATDWQKRCGEKCPKETLATCERIDGSLLKYCFCYLAMAKRYWTLNVARQLFPSGGLSRKSTGQSSLKLDKPLPRKPEAPQTPLPSPSPSPPNDADDGTTKGHNRDDNLGDGATSDIGDSSAAAINSESLPVNLDDLFEGIDDELVRLEAYLDQCDKEKSRQLKSKAEWPGDL